MQNFPLLQQAGHGVILIAKTGEQAVQVNEFTGNIALVLGASTASGPVKNPEMIVDGHKAFHEQPFYSEFFQGEYIHEFFVYPCEGNWNDSQVSDYARRLISDVYMFDIPVNNTSSQTQFPKTGSFVSVQNQNIEITSIDKKSGKFVVRLNERNNKNSQGSVSIGKHTNSFSVSPNSITEIDLK